MRGGGLSLRWRVALSVSLLLVVVTGAVAVALIRYESFFLTREGEKRVSALAENLAANARDPLLDGDELRLGTIVQSLMREEDALYAYVVDHRGVVVYHTDIAPVGLAYPGEMPRPGKDVLEAAAAITTEDTELGTAVVGLAARFIDQALRATALGLLTPLSVGALVAVVGTFLLTGLHVKRIEKLEQAVRALGSGDLLVQAEVRGRDEVSRLAGHFNEMVAQLQGARGEIERGFTETVSSLAAAIEAKDAYTRGHCERVARLARAIARRMGMTSTDLKDLELAAILHDVGKIGVRGDILGKIGRLDDAEIENMRKHPDIGAGILDPLSFLGDVATYVRHHHENYDGTGYPEGLAGKDIPLPSRIIRLVDAYDAMTSSRPYRPALPHDEAIARITAARGNQFDPRVVEAFFALEREGAVAAIRTQVEEDLAP